MQRAWPQWHELPVTAAVPLTISTSKCPGRCNQQVLFARIKVRPAKPCQGKINESLTTGPCFVSSVGGELTSIDQPTCARESNAPCSLQGWLIWKNPGKTSLVLSLR